MMENTFLNLELDISYRSDTDDISQDFYLPCLEKTIFYDRASGYFTSDTLKLLTSGIQNIIKNNGKIRIVTSPNLTLDDIKAIDVGEQIKLIEQKTLKEWEKFEKEEKEDNLKLLSWMIARGTLEIKIAYQKNGLYHEKFGIMKDININKICFSGSVNETIGGIKNNFESIDVFSSINGESEMKRILKKEEEFENLWNNKTNKIEVMTLTDAINKRILSINKKTSTNEIEAILLKLTKEKFKLTIPKNIEIRQYQKNAFNKWIENNYIGILEMATGTGKTITALNIAKKLSELTNYFLIIVCPQNYLVNQWKEEISKFGGKSIICNSDNKQWKDLFSNNLFLFNEGEVNFVSVITTTKTLQTEAFLRRISRIKKDIFIIVDECHNLGSKNFEEITKRKELLKIKYRLGLSATLDRKDDFEGNLIIKNYLGTKIYEFTMEEAIKYNFLTNYKYFPIFVPLTDDEEKEYIKLTKQIIKLSFLKDEKNDTLESLLFKRARILNLAQNKTYNLVNSLNTSDYNTLIYVGAGSINEEKNIDEILRLLENKGLKAKKFTSTESREERIKIVKEFENKEINMMIAIKCLDEGVNIPCIEKAYILASTSNYREYVQRRGRLLRKSPGKEIALIYDYVVMPKSYFTYEKPENSIQEIEKKLILSELKRVTEYNSLALNKYRNQKNIRDIIERYNLNI